MRWRKLFLLVSTNILFNIITLEQCCHVTMVPWEDCRYWHVVFKIGHSHSLPQKQSSKCLNIIPTLVKIYSTSIMGFFYAPLEMPKGLMKKHLSWIQKKTQAEITFASFSLVSLFLCCCTTSHNRMELCSVFRWRFHWPSLQPKPAGSKQQISKAVLWHTAWKWASNKPQITTGRPLL